MAHFKKKIGGLSELKGLIAKAELETNKEYQFYVRHYDIDG